MFKYLFIFLSLLSTSYAEVISVDDLKFNIDVPQSWRVSHKLFALPVALVSPLKDGKRLIVGITPTKKAFGYFKTMKLKEQENIYLEGRKKWLKKFNGKLKIFKPLEHITTDTRGEYYKIGYLYEMTNHTFEEFTYYKNCNGMLYHLKTLREVDIYKDATSIDQIVRSFHCK